MDREKARLLHVDLNAAMAALAKKHGLLFEPARLSYSATDIRTTVRLSEPLTSATVSPEAEPMSVKNAMELELMGLKVSDVGAKFRYNSKDWKFVGLKMRRKQYPVVAENLADGKKYKLPLSAIETLRR